MSSMGQPAAAELRTLCDNPLAKRDNLLACRWRVQIIDADVKGHIKRFTEQAFDGLGFYLDSKKCRLLSLVAALRRVPIAVIWQSPS